MHTKWFAVSVPGDELHGSMVPHFGGLSRHTMEPYRMTFFKNSGHRGFLVLFFSCKKYSFIFKKSLIAVCVPFFVSHSWSDHVTLVPMVGLEPTRVISPTDFESVASASSATSAKALQRPWQLCSICEWFLFLCLASVIIRGSSWHCAPYGMVWSIGTVSRSAHGLRYIKTTQILFNNCVALFVLHGIQTRCIVGFCFRWFLL